MVSEVRSRRGLEFPEFGDRHGEELEFRIQRQDGVSVIQDDAALKVTPSLRCQAFEAVGIGWLDACGGFDFHTPGKVALCQHTVDLHLIDQGQFAH